MDRLGGTASPNSDLDDERLRGIVGTYMAMQKTSKRRLRPIAAALLGAAAIALYSYVTMEIGPISSQQAVVVGTLVHEAAAENHEKPEDVWGKIAGRTGASDPSTLREWYYSDAINICVEEIERARLASTAPN